MTDQILKIADDFWNIRGVFKLGGVVNIGTHCSLVERQNGNFLLLDAYTLEGDVKREVDSLTNNGALIEAVLNLHPFHTVHVKRSHEQYPNAKLYGTQRHIDKFPELPWQPELTESAELHALFADDLEFSVPAGVDFISANENIHFSSVMVRHIASKTVHVDDTLMCLKLPKVLASLVKKEAVIFHPTLGKALEPRAGAAADFRQWANELAAQWGDSNTLCAAHSATLSCSDSQPLEKRILKALSKTERTLKAHEKKYG